MSSTPPPRPSFAARLRQKFLREPAGYGRPIPVAALDHEYASGSWSHFHGLSELARMAVVVVTASTVRANPAVLDLGCGSGRLAQLFQPYAPRRYVGVDLSREGLKIARDLNLAGCEFIEGNFETWRPQEQFDVVMFSECIGYATDPGETARTFAQFISPGGCMIISHFRFGHFAAQWRRIEQHLAVKESTAVTNAKGQTWDVKVLVPHAQA